MYVIYLNTNRNVDDWYGNNYGYWTGEQSVVQKELYPTTERAITEKTKKYKSRKAAETSAEKCFEKFGYVSSVKVEKIESKT